MWKAEDVRKELETVTRAEVKEFVVKKWWESCMWMYQVCVCVSMSVSIYSCLISPLLPLTHLLTHTHPHTKQGNCNEDDANTLTALLQSLLKEASVEPLPPQEYPTNRVVRLPEGVNIVLATDSKDRCVCVCVCVCWYVCVCP